MKMKGIRDRFYPNQYKSPYFYITLLDLYLNSFYSCAMFMEVNDSIVCFLRLCRRFYKKVWAGYRFSDFIDNFERELTIQLYSFRLFLANLYFVKVKQLYLCCFSNYFHGYSKQTTMYLTIRQEKYSFM